MGWLLDWQIEVLRWIETFRTPLFDQLFLLLTKLGEEEIVIIVISWLYWNWNKALTTKATYAFTLVLLLNIGLKDLFDIARPFDYDNTLRTANEIYQEEVAEGLGYAFPSGHATIGAGWLTAVGTLFNKRWVWITAGILIALVGFSRMYIGVHYPLDVVVGIVLGVLVVIYGQTFYNRLPNNVWRYGLPLLILVPFVLFGLNEDFYKAYGLYIGFAAGVLLEQRFDVLQPAKSTLHKVLRFVLGVVLVLVIQQGLKVVFPEGANAVAYFFATLRYVFVGLMLFVGSPKIFQLLKI